MYLVRHASLRFFTAGEVPFMLWDWQATSSHAMGLTNTKEALEI
jgi:hypothetical protein